VFSTNELEELLELEKLPTDSEEEELELSEEEL